MKARETVTVGGHDMSSNAWEWCCDTGGAEYVTERRVNPCNQGKRPPTVMANRNRVVALKVMEEP
jgi:hypothetical protein